MWVPFCFKALRWGGHELIWNYLLGSSRTGRNRSLLAELDFATAAEVDRSQLSDVYVLDSAAEVKETGLVRHFVQVVIVNKVRGGLLAHSALFDPI